MDIQEYGEFKLISEITKIVKHSSIIKGIGDDCAVLTISSTLKAYAKNKKDNSDKTNNEFILVTTDMFVNNNHFNTEWYTPEQIGKKIIEASISDIAACGGSPLYATIAMSLPKTTDVDWIKKVYLGIYNTSEKHRLLIVGGDSTSGKEISFSVTIIGKVHDKELCLRGHAQVNDLILISGTVGKSMAGLQVFFKEKELKNKKKNEYIINKNNNYIINCKEAHLNPRCRLDVSTQIAKYVHAMIDISDGVSSEIKHICNESNVGAAIEKEKIPLNNETKKTAEMLGQDPYDWALYGGEDFELLFTISQNTYNEYEELFKDCSVIGKILKPELGCYMIDKQ